MAYGTMTTLDSLAANTTSQTVVAFGEDRLWDAIDANFRVHNALVQEMLSDLAEPSTDRQRRYGGLDEMVMEMLDQGGRPDAQKITAGSTVGFPLRLAGGSLQWTRKALQVMTVQEIAKQALAMLSADRKLVQNELKKAIFFSTNYTFTDVLLDSVDLPVKRLVNADSQPIPIGPNGETFTASSHTHYLATASFIAANLTSLVDTVAEHVNSGQVLVYINRAQEAAVRALTGFTPYNDPRIIYPTNAAQATQNVNLMNVGNRAIGIFGSAEIWVKPWVPANYLFAFVRGSALGKPVVFRTRDGGGDFGLVADDELHPLRAKSYEREFGFGVWNRVNGAVLYIASGTYANPSL